MANFDLASVLKDAGAQMGTGREQIEYIDIDKIDADANNFYAMSGISALMANIELIGLQQPIRVRPNPDAPERYIVVSGHRRLTAFQQLRADKDGGERWATIPAIVEACADSADLQELRLIYANADTRKISDFELRKQAERVEELLYKLKEQGVEFPGRMRDHVAEACKISKSKLGRLKQIKDGLAPDISRAYYETGTLNEAAALELAKLPEDVQREIVEHKKKNADRVLDASSLSPESRDELTVAGISATYVSNMGEDILRLREFNCPACAGATCINKTGILDKIYSNGYRQYAYCGQGARRCCYKCPDLATCGKSCLRMKAKKDKLRAEKKAAKAEAEAAYNARAATKFERTKDLWQRMNAACTAAGVDYLKMCDDVGIWGMTTVAHQMFAGGDDASVANTPTPYSYSCSLDAVDKLTKIADMLDVSLDYLLGRTDEMRMRGDDNDT